MAFGVDYTTPTTDTRKLKAAGVKFVCRYSCPTSQSWKRCTTAEVNALRRAGIGLVLVWETTANRVLGGAPAGKADAQEARQHLAELGLISADPSVPNHCVVYFAVDFDAAGSNQPVINSYLKAAGGVLGADCVGIYAGFYPLERALAAKACKWGWQTYAWSGGHVSQRAHLLQYSNGHSLAGLSVDYNHSLKAEYGNVLAGTKPDPKPKRVWELIQGGHVIWHGLKVPAWVRQLARTLKGAKIIRKKGHK